MDAAHITSRVGGGPASSSSSGEGDRKQAALPPAGSMPPKRLVDSQPEAERQAWPLFVGCSDLPSFPVKRRAQVSSSSASSSSSSCGDDAASSATGYEASCSSYSRNTYSVSRASACSSPSILSLGDSSLDELEESYFMGSKLQARYQSAAQASTAPTQNQHQTNLLYGSRLPLQLSSPLNQLRAYSSPEEVAASSIPATVLIDGKPPLLAMGSDVTAHVLSFLDPPEILRVLTAPICKEWRQAVTSHQDIWKVLCLMEPFKANVAGAGDARRGHQDDDDDDDDDDSFCSILDTENDVMDIFGKYRIMYTSFVRCFKYLTRIKEDAESGRPPSAITAPGGTKATTGSTQDTSPNNNLTSFLSRAQGVVENHTARALSSGATAADGSNISSAPIGVSDDGYSTDENAGETRPSGNGRKRPAPTSLPSSKKPKFASSSITSKLLGVSGEGTPSHTNLPKSCAVFSIVNWMVAHTDVEGIQAMCIKALPSLLEDEDQRLTAQRAGLTDVVLRAMVLYPDCLDIHVAAFHTMVLLARPLGGREGQLFDNSLENSSTVGLLGATISSQASTVAERLGVVSIPACSSRWSCTTSDGRGTNGIAIMLDSMRRFESEERLQAMACWAMVNIALAPSQKKMLICMGGIQAAINAMQNHPRSPDVQFRALFALINLVIPSRGKIDRSRRLTGGSPNDTTEKEILDRLIGEVTRLVVAAMKNFCSSETILNRACLVLHNLSQCQEYVATLLWTPHCFQMVEWCIANYPTDQVLRRSAVSTLHRLQVALSNDPTLRARFMESIRRQKDTTGTSSLDEIPGVAGRLDNSTSTEAPRQQVQ